MRHGRRSRTAIVVALAVLALLMLLGAGGAAGERFATPSDTAGAYVINLDKHADRMAAFLAAYEAADARLPLERVPAVDGARADWAAVTTPQALEDLRDVAATGSRKRHDQLTPGAVGCYLSHVKVWERFVDSGRDWALVFEDDARVPADLRERVTEALRVAPKFDILLLGWEGEVQPLAKRLVLVRRFCRTHAYVITREAARSLLTRMLPMSRQLDWALSARIPLGLRVLATADQVVGIAPGFGTSIQTPLR